VRLIEIGGKGSSSRRRNGIDSTKRGYSRARAGHQKYRRSKPPKESAFSGHQEFEQPTAEGIAVKEGCGEENSLTKKNKGREEKHWQGKKKHLAKREESQFGTG